MQPSMESVSSVELEGEAAVPVGHENKGVFRHLRRASLPVITKGELLA